MAKLIRVKVPVDAVSKMSSLDDRLGDFGQLNLDVNFRSLLVLYSYVILFAFGVTRNAREEYA